MFSSESKILHHLRSQSTIQSIAILVFKPAVLPGKGRNGDGDGVDRVVGEVVLLWLQAPHLLEHLRTTFYFMRYSPCPSIVCKTVMIWSALSDFEESTFLKKLDNNASKSCRITLLVLCLKLHHACNTGHNCQQMGRQCPFVQLTMRREGLLTNGRTWTITRTIPPSQVIRSSLRAITGPL